MDVQTEKILDRVVKLMAVANDKGASEAEAQSAAAKATALLTRYNLDMAQLAAHHSKGTAPVYGIRRFDGGKGWSFTKNQRRRLIVILAKYNFCRAIWRTGTVWFTLTGQDDNTKIVEYLYTTISAAFTRIAYQKAIRARDTEAIPMKEYLSSFYEGALVGLHLRLHNERRETEQQFDQDTGASSQALIVLKDNELREAEQQLVGRVRRREINNNRVSHGNAFHEGEQTAQSVNLSRPLPSGDSHALQGE